jgi:hypothetical protein
MQFNSVKSTTLVNGGSIAGRVWLLGLTVTPIYTATSTVQLEVNGTIKLHNGDSSGDVLVEVPVTMTEGYPAGMGFDYVEHGGYLVFPDGLYVAQSTVAGDPLDTSLTSFSVFYQV